MTGAAAVDIATTAAFALLILAMLGAVIRLTLGPTLADRILALDLLNTLGMGAVAVFALRSGVLLYVDIAIGLGLVGFLSTLALVRYLLRRGDGAVTGEKEAAE